ncbi:AvrPphF family type III effector (plasmid) [Burkholderia sp. M6-3]
MSCFQSTQISKSGGYALRSLDADASNEVVPSARTNQSFSVTQQANAQFKGLAPRVNNGPTAAAASSSVPSQRPRSSLRTSAPDSSTFAASSLAAMNSGNSTEATYVTRSGKRLLSIDSLPESRRSNLLKNNDPVQKLGLTDESVFYRVTERKWVANWRISGNPESIARISNHLALQDNPQRAQFEKWLESPDLGEEDREGLRKQLDRMPRHTIATMDADELPHPSLNVMYGETAASCALRYATNDMALVKIRLGDLRRAGGGSVFYDRTSAMQGALIVTLPAGRSIPIEIIEAAAQ